MFNTNRTVFEFLFQWSGHNGAFDALVIFFAKFFPYFLVVASVVWISRFANWKLRLAIFAEGLLAVIVSNGTITETLHFFYNNPRPFAALGLDPLITENSFSFPSGHAAFYFAIATTIFYYNRRIGWWFFGFATLNGLARVMAGVHWPLDILGGAVAGVISAVLIHKLLEPHLKKISQKENAPAHQ